MAKKTSPKKLREEDLSPKQKKERDRLRAQFKDLYECFKDLDILDAEGALQELEVGLEALFFALKDKVFVKDFELPEGISDRMKYFIEVIGECTVGEAVTHCRYLANAMNQHKYHKLKDLTVKDLDINVL